MKGRGKRQRARAELQDSFIRGFVSAGLLAAVEGRARRQYDSRRILRLALQGGTALAAGSVAATALQKRELATTLTAVAAGAAGLLTIEHLLREKNSRENKHGQEKA